MAGGARLQVELALSWWQARKLDPKVQSFWCRQLMDPEPPPSRSRLRSLTWPAASRQGTIVPKNPSIHSIITHGNRGPVGPAVILLHR